MSFITIASGISSDSYASLNHVPICYLDDYVGYSVYINGSGEVVYSKTIDGGNDWDTPVVLVSGVADVAGLSVYPDWATPGDTGTKVWFCYAESTNNKLHYGYIDTSDDSHDTGDVVDMLGNGNFYWNPSYVWNCCYTSICKSKSGYLYIWWRAMDDSLSTNAVFLCSINNGSSWVEKDDTLVSYPGGDVVQLMPAAGATEDTNDIWAIRSNYVSWEWYFGYYDYSADTWDQEFIVDSSVSINPASYGRHQSAWTIDESTGELVVTLRTTGCTTYVIGGAGDITEKGSIADLEYFVGMKIDYDTGRWYLFYLDGTYGSNYLMYTYHSDNNGVTWTYEGSFSNGGDSTHFDLCYWPYISGGPITGVWFTDGDWWTRVQGVYHLTINKMFIGNMVRFRKIPIENIAKINKLVV